MTPLLPIVRLILIVVCNLLSLNSVGAGRFGRTPYRRSLRLCIPRQQPLFSSNVRSPVNSIRFRAGKSCARLESRVRKTVEYGMPNYLLFSRDPFLDRIRKDPAFIQFMAELKPRWEGYQREFQ